MCASTFSHPTAATLLIEARASVHARTAFPALTSLHFTCNALHGAPCVAVLATARADLEVRMKTDVTPLMWAAVLNNAEVAQALLDAKSERDHILDAVTRAADAAEEARYQSLRGAAALLDDLLG